MAIVSRLFVMMHPAVQLVAKVVNTLVHALSEVFGVVTSRASISCIGRRVVSARCDMGITGGRCVGSVVGARCRRSAMCVSASNSVASTVKDAVEIGPNHLTDILYHVSKNRGKASKQANTR